MAVQLLVLFLGLCGLLLSSHIHEKKHKAEQTLVCPLRGKCDEVVHSPYASFLGVPVERIGMLYYGIVAMGYAFVLMINPVHHPLQLLLFCVTSVAFLFSLYLTCVQVFILRKLCTWCLLSAFFCTAIFVVSFHA